MPNSFSLRQPDESHWMRVECPRCQGQGTVPGFDSLTAGVADMRCCACKGIGIAYHNLTAIPH